MTAEQAIARIHQIIYDDTHRFVVDRLTLAIDALDRGAATLAAGDLQLAVNLIGQIDTRVADAVVLLNSPALGAVQRLEVRG